MFHWLAVFEFHCLQTIKLNVVAEVKCKKSLCVVRENKAFCHILVTCNSRCRQCELVGVRYRRLLRLVVWRNESSYPVDGDVVISAYCNPSHFFCDPSHLPVIGKVACGAVQYVGGTSLVQVPRNLIPSAFNHVCLVIIIN